LGTSFWNTGILTYIYVSLKEGWPDEFAKKSPKMLPNHFFVKINNT
jgi:hypothetical protein